MSDSMVEEALAALLTSPQASWDRRHWSRRFTEYVNKDAIPDHKVYLAAKKRVLRHPSLQLTINHIDCTIPAWVHGAPVDLVSPVLSASGRELRSLYDAIENGSAPVAGRLPLPDYTIDCLYEADLLRLGQALRSSSARKTVP